MPTSTLDLEPHSNDRHYSNTIPWLIAAICTVVLLIVTTQTARHISADLQTRALQQFDRTRFDAVTVHADGRDLIVQGEVHTDQPVSALISALNSVEGVQSVRNQLTMTDPVLEARTQIEQFQRAIQGLDLEGAVTFEPASTRLTASSTDALAPLASLLKQYPLGRIRIAGHTDNTGADSVNLRVSRQRAAAVAQHLIAQGVLSEQLFVVGYGDTQPVADNDTEAGRARNRRIEINAVL